MDSSQHIDALAADIDGALRWLQLWLICAALCLCFDELVTEPST